MRGTHARLPAAAEQAEAERRAAEGARDGSAQQLREAEARFEAAEEAVAELRTALERQQATFAQQEDRAAREAADLQRRAAEAEARHEVPPPPTATAPPARPAPDRCKAHWQKPPLRGCAGWRAAWTSAARTGADSAWRVQPAVDRLWGCPGVSDGAAGSHGGCEAV